MTNLNTINSIVKGQWHIFIHANMTIIKTMGVDNIFLASLKVTSSFSHVPCNRKNLQFTQSYMYKFPSSKM